MHISKYTNLKGQFPHSWGAEAKEDINYILGHDYFPRMFNNSTRFLELRALNEREMIFKDKYVNDWGDKPKIVTCIKSIVINRRTKRVNINKLYESNSTQEINKIFREINSQYNKITSIKKVLNFLKKGGYIVWKKN